MAKPKKDAKKIVLPHSKAKLDLYKNYLEHYLRILSLAPFCKRINLYDIFCGIGLYEDGNMGSPLIARECTKNTHVLLQNLSKPITPISITVNDKEKEKIQKVQELLELESLPATTYRYFNEDADKMLDIVATEINAREGTERNLVFIDPYGYSRIDKEKVYNILKNECSEVILFLPVMQMYRFTDIALTDTERTCYAHLRKFISSFFPPAHKIHADGIDNIFEYINEIKIALSFEGQFFTSSHYIEREKGNYYALFFITSNIYGLEKMLEAKWKMDPVKGKGFDQNRNTAQTFMFGEEFQEHDKRKELEFLSDVILNAVQVLERLTNNDIYKLSLINEFRPTHANSVLKQLTKNKIKVAYHDGIVAGNLEFYGISYENYKRDIIKALFLKK